MIQYWNSAFAPAAGRNRHSLSSINHTDNFNRIEHYEVRAPIMMTINGVFGFKLLAHTRQTQNAENSELIGSFVYKDCLY